MGCPRRAPDAAGSNATRNYSCTLSSGRAAYSGSSSKLLVPMLPVTIQAAVFNLGGLLLETETEQTEMEQDEALAAVGAPVFAPRLASSLAGLVIVAIAMLCLCLRDAALIRKHSRRSE